ncbi:MAG: hypothetical protein SNJ80_09340 [Anaerolinea sp.]
MKRTIVGGVALLGLMVSALPAAGMQSAVDCSRYELAEDSLWNDFSGLLDEGGVSAELWNRLNGAGVMSLEDYGITGDELQAFFDANGEAINALTDNNPLKPYLDEALAIMGGYGLGSGDINPLLAVRSDVPALFAALAARGLDAPTADAFLSEIAPIVREVSDRGLLKYAAVVEADAAMNQVNGTLSPRFLANYINDLDAFEALLLEGGSDPQAVAALMDELDLLQARGLDQSLLQRYEVETQRAQLAKYGVPAAAMRQLVGADAATIADCLEQLGLSDAEGLAGVFDDLSDLDPEALDLYLAQEMAEFLAISELTPEEMAELLSLSGEDLRDALNAIYDPSYADWLYGQLTSSAFYGFSQFGDLDDALFDMASEIAEGFDEADFDSLFEGFALGEMFDALDELDDEAFALLFDDLDALESWLAEGGSDLDEDDPTADEADTTGGSTTGDANDAPATGDANQGDANQGDAAGDSADDADDADDAGGGGG